MPSPLLHLGAAVTCAHGGPAQPVEVNPRVTVSGQPVVTLPGNYVITGCPLAATAGPAPCSTGEFITAANRVAILGNPVILQEGSSICVPSGTPLRVLGGQMRVTAR